jgi:phage terminase large subunit-like protein
LQSSYEGTLEAEDFAPMVVADAIGMQEPRILAVPECETSLGIEAIELAESAGLVLDPWEAFVLDKSLGRRADGLWSAFEVGLVVSRQNGKGAILEARELAGMFLVKERLIIHSAHQFDTSLEAFRRLLWLIEDTPDLDSQVQRVSRSHGEEGIELKGGNRIRFRTRTKGGGRGFSSDCLILDEAMILPESSHGALLPTLSARPIPQVWYTGSAVDQLVHEDGIVLARVRERGLKGDDPRLAYFEWSVDRDNPEDVDDELASDEEAWAQANPALGIRISTDHVAAERRSMDDRTFIVERLGVGDWPSTDGGAGVIDMETWIALEDLHSEMGDPVCLSFDVSPSRSWASICAAGKREDGLLHVEVVDRRAGTGWVVSRLIELVSEHGPASLVCDATGPVASLLQALEAEGIAVETVTAAEHGQACGLLVDAVEQREVRHLGSDELKMAIRGASTRPLGDAWAWSRKSSGTDITPLVGCTLALWKAAAGTGEAGFAFV